VLIDVADHDDPLRWSRPLTRDTQQLPSCMAEVAGGLARSCRKPTACLPKLRRCRAGETAQAIAHPLPGGKNAAVLLGNSAVNHPQFASVLAANAQWYRRRDRRTLGFLTEGGNTVGALSRRRHAGRRRPERRADAFELSRARVTCCCNVEPTLDSTTVQAAARALAALKQVRNGGR
jgi:NADH-quinone oxidoreductase subunit G